MNEALFWADQIARNVKERVEKSPLLKKIVKQNGYIVYDEKTPSGKIHVGSGRGWVLHDVIAKCMREIGLKARFILSSDDIDPYDKPNKDLPETFNKYLGMPFMDIPSPVKGYDSFADYYFTQVTDKFEEFGIEAELESTGQRYRNGDFNKSIKTILDNHDKVAEIYKRFYGKKPEKLPFNPVCEKCGKIGTTYAYEWDPKNEVIRYECKPDLVSWAKGCGHKGEMSPYDGNGKFPWKVEWAAKWPTVGVVCEYAGKDHFTKGGSRSISVAISSEILNFPPPYPSTGKATGNGYEFFTIGGKKMSTSKGMGIGFAEMTNYLPAQMIRYLLVRTRPKARVDFDPMDDNDMVLLYDRYDRTQRVYYGSEKVNDKEEMQEKRIYELSVTDKIPKKQAPQISLKYAATIAQISPSIDTALKMLRKTGHVPGKITKSEENEIKKRIEFAKSWVSELASDDYKIELMDRIYPDTRKRLTNEQVSAVQDFAKELGKKDHTEKQLYDLFWEVSEKNGIKAPKLFQALYLILIGKERGPRLAPFILAVGKKKILSVLKTLR